MMDDALLRPERWARFRFSVIGGLLASPPEGGALQDALRALAARPYQHPFTHERIRLGIRTRGRGESVRIHCSGAVHAAHPTFERPCVFLQTRNLPVFLVYCR